MPDEKIIGKHLIYRYDNGWRYELYVKNATTIDYRLHSGMVGGRWVKHQEVHLNRIAGDTYKVSWTEPTGTSVSLTINLQERQLHGVIFFPAWVAAHPERTVCFQNEWEQRMAEHRQAGPTYPITVVDEFATITFVETCAANDESVIDRAPSELPDGYADRVG